MNDVIDHVNLAVTDFPRALAFYDAALATLGIDRLAEFTVGQRRFAGYGREGRPRFWLSSGATRRGDVHLAFVANSRAEITAFYSVALSMGGRDNGAPGLRAQYHPNYFAAFVLDPDGHNIEAVCHEPV